MRDYRRPANNRVGQWDEGTASERTVLAWERTAIATIAVAVLVVREGVVERLLGVAVPVAAVLVVAGVTEWRFGLHVYEEHDRPFHLGAIIHDRAIAALTFVTLIAAAGSAALALGG